METICTATFYNYVDQNKIEGFSKDELPVKSKRAMTFMCDEKILNLLNVYYIEPDEVQLNIDLLKK